MAVSTGLMVLVTYSWYRLLPLILREMGATDAQIGISYTVLTLAQALLQYPGGWLGDKFGRKLMICLPGAVFGTAYIVSGMTRSWQVVVGCAAVVAGCNALQAPSFTAIITESVGPRSRGLALSVYQTSVSAALALGPALGALLCRWVSPRTLMIATGLCSYAVSLWRWCSLSETSAPQTPSLGAVDWQSVWSILVVGVPFAFLAPLTVTGPFVQLYSKDALGFTQSDVNMLFVVGPLASALMMTAGGRIIDLKGAARVLALTSMAHAVSILAWTRLRHPAASWLVFGLAYLWLQVATISYDTMRSNMASQTSRGMVLGLTGTVSGSLASAAPALASMLSARFGNTVPFVLAVVFAGLTSACCYGTQLRTANPRSSCFSSGQDPRK
ncbi:MAG: MFS transporter [Bacillota bacterium]